jgi:hypothetical protein
MISQIVTILRPVCVVATIAIAVTLILCFWGWQVVTWDTFWKLLLSYIALMVASTLICAIDNPARLSGRER